MAMTSGGSCRTKKANWWRLLAKERQFHCNMESEADWALVIVGVMLYLLRRVGGGEVFLNAKDGLL